MPLRFMNPFDSSWLEFNTNTLKLRTAGGSQLSFELINGEYRCKEVKDTNGNYSTIAHDSSSGRINSIVDTLGRMISFVYQNNNLQKITQLWNNVEHIWAQFDYGSTQLQTSFTGVSSVTPPSGTFVTVLTKVTLDD